MHAQSCSNVSHDASAARLLMRDGTAVAASTRESVSLQNRKQTPTIANGTGSSRQNHANAPAKNRGLLSAGHFIYRARRGSGFHRGPGVDTRISASVRAGRRAAYRNATTPPNDTPHMTASSMDSASSTLFR